MNVSSCILLSPDGARAKPEFEAISFFHSKDPLTSSQNGDSATQSCLTLKSPKLRQQRGWGRGRGVGGKEGCLEVSRLDDCSKVASRPGGSWRVLGGHVAAAGGEQEGPQYGVEVPARWDVLAPGV